MRKLDVIREISQKTGIEKTLVEATVEAFMNTVKDHVAAKHTVNLRGFGNFIVKKRAARTARNITKGTVIQVHAHYVPAFRPSKLFTTKVRKASK